MRTRMIVLFPALIGLSTLLAHGPSNDRSAVWLGEVNSGSRSVAPTGFEENKGQVTTTAGEPAPEVRFRYTQGGTSIFLLHTGIAYQFNRLHRPEGLEALEEEARYHPEHQEELDAMRARTRLETYRMDMLLEGADPHATVTTEGRSTDYTQYYTHDVLDVHTYRRITYHAVYPGIDWVVYTTASGFKYDFVVHPGADPARIILRFLHHEELCVEADGSLTHGNRMGRFTEEAPVSFQDGRTVGTRFVLHADAERPGEALLHFDLDPYDRSRALRIDPARIWGTYYGASGPDYGVACAVDSSGGVFLAGETQSTNDIAISGHQIIYAGSADAFLVKFSSTGIREWATYYGGVGIESGLSCATDLSGGVFLCGWTNSSTGIADGGHQNNYAGGGKDAFLVKFDNSGIRIWGTYYGGADEEDEGLACVADHNGNIYMSGVTESTSGISSNGHQNNFGGLVDAFLVKFSGTGVLLWGTYYGGNDFERGQSCSVDYSGSVFLAGSTQSTTSIASGGHQNFLFFDRDAFLVKFSSSGTRQWGTYYGGGGFDNGFDCDVDSDGNVFLAGDTQDSFSEIAFGGHQGMYGGACDAFLAKFNTAGNRLWGTYYGGGDFDSGLSCSVDFDGSVFLAGITGSTFAISSGGHQDSLGGSIDGFIVKFSDTGIRHWGSYYGGSDYDAGIGCTTDGYGYIYLAGYTSSSNAIASDGHQEIFGGNTDSFLAKFDGGSTLGIDTEAFAPFGFAVFPNPASDQLTVRLERIPAHGDRYQVLDAQGRSVLRGRLTQQVSTIDLGSLGTGAYLLQVRTAEGVRTERFIKQ